MLKSQLLRLFIFLLPFGSLAQETACFKTQFVTKEIHVLNDTVLVVTQTNEQTNKELKILVQTTGVYLKNGRKMDTLFKVLPNTEYLDNKDGFNLLEFNPYPEVFEWLHGYPDTDSEFEVPHNFQATTDVSHVSNGIFSLTTGYWVYSGGAHGYGSNSFKHYDNNTKTFFTLDEVLKPGGYRKIFDCYIKLTTEKDSLFDLDAEQYELALENLELSDSQYMFEKDGLTVICQMYDTLYGIIGNGFSMQMQTIPYAMLKEFIRKDAPVIRLMRN